MQLYLEHARKDRPVAKSLQRVFETHSAKLPGLHCAMPIVPKQANLCLKANDWSLHATLATSAIAKQVKPFDIETSMN
jgi:hypothetical protein